MHIVKHVSICLSVILGASIASADPSYTTTGAEFSTDEGAEIYTWTSTNEVGTIVVPSGGALFDILLVGGGGAGGFCRGGGGGGGGVLYQSGVFLEAGTYTITVGAGGVPDVWPGQSYGAKASQDTTDGRHTILSNATEAVRIAYGGGGGATFSSGVSRAGGSSGGCSNCGTVAPDGVAGQGHHGGATHPTNNYRSGGGGGAGGPGVDGTSSKSGDGGPGFACSISGVEVLYGAGGGGGAESNDASACGAGGNGGGGHGGSGNNANMTAGADGVGAGGGGGSGQGNSAANCGGARGGNGIAIFRTAAASRPDFANVEVTVTDGTNVTFAALLYGMGTNPQGSASATGCDIYLAYGTDPENLVSAKVKSGWDLTDTSWSMTVYDVPSYSRFYWRVAVTNDLGVGAEAEQSGYGRTTGPGRPIAVKYGFSDPQFAFNGSAVTICYYDLPALFDGLVNRACDLKLGKTPNVLLDAGEAKTLRMFRTYSANESVASDLANFELYGSNDTNNWTKLADAGDFIFAITNEVWLEAYTHSSSAYRYFEMRGIPDVKLAEVELISDDMSLRFDKPTMYVRNGDGLEAVNIADDPDGVKISGKLMNGLAGTEIYGYCAEADYGADESGWIANGSKFTISGTFAAGATFSRKVQFEGRGQRFIRLFAKNGSTVTSSQRTWEIGLGTKAKLFPAYSREPNLYKMYDADPSTSYDSGGSSWVIFDLRGLKNKEYISHLKLWPVMGAYNQFTWTRCRVGKIYVSYDNAVVTPVGETLVAGREVYKINSDPAVNWTCIRPYMEEMVTIHAYTDYIYPDFDPDVRPTFLKIGGFYRENCREIEFRVVSPPPGVTIIYR